MNARAGRGASVKDPRGGWRDTSAERRATVRHIRHRVRRELAATRREVDRRV